MIREINLKGVQRHRDITLKLHKHVNVLTGPTDSGKSTNIRALRLLFFNNPPNAPFVKDGEAEGSVTVRLDDGHTVTRARKGKGVNTYILDGTVKKGFGRAVPQEVAAVFDMSETINLQRQSEQYFYLAVSSSTERAKILESYTELRIISVALNNARRAILHYTRELNGSVAAREAAAREVRTLKNALPSNDSTELLFRAEREYRSRCTLLSSAERNYSSVLSFRDTIAGLSACRSPGAEKRLQEAATARQGLSRELSGLEGRYASHKAAARACRGAGVPDGAREAAARLRRTAAAREESRLEVCALREALSAREEAEREEADAAERCRLLKLEMKKFKLCPTCKRAL